MAGYPDVEVFHGAPWLAFLADSQGAEPVVAVVRVGERTVGHFVGAIVRRYGVRILGSPLRGWGTQCMGFLLEEGADRRAAADALVRFAFNALGCVHVELADRLLDVDSMAGSGYVTEPGHTFRIDLNAPEDVMLKRMRPTTRNYIRQAQRKALQAMAVSDAGFADEYHAQLVEVFARQGLAPTYGVERVRQLMRALKDTGQLATMRVATRDGEGIATVIAIGRKDTAVLWGAAFRRSHAESHPNELLHWEAMRVWRARGAVRYDMGGGGDYKAKYGGVQVSTAHYYRSRYPFLRYGRIVVRRLARLRQVVGALRKSSAASRLAGGQS